MSNMFSRRMRGAIKQAKSTYHSRGFQGFIKAASILFLRKLRILPFYRARFRRLRRRKLLKHSPLRLHLGCGSKYLDGYVNIDKFKANADLVMDAEELDFPDSSVDEIFTSHMVEHLDYPSFMKALEEWKRVLKKDGILIIRCPNFEWHLRNWLDGDYKQRWGERNEGVNVILGFQDRGPGYVNRNIFTIDRLTDLVSKVGFEVIECYPIVSRYGDTPDADILLRSHKRVS